MSVFQCFAIYFDVESGMKKKHVFSFLIVMIWNCTVFFPEYSLSAKDTKNASFSSQERSPSPACTQAERTKAITRVEMRGMTISCHGWGAMWASSVMKQTMKNFKELGGNWISTHPYAWIQNDGSLKFSESLLQPSVLKPMEYAHQLGIKMLLKPHIGYWGSRFPWRGEITFKTEAEWKRFFASYRRWIVIQAKMAQKGGAHLFSVGVEYRKTLHRTKDWENVIREVRKVYHGQLTYSANWDSYDKVRFWSSLDMIGIQAYFSLSKMKNPHEEALRKGWKPIMARLENFSKKMKKKILFTELGYNRASHTAARPWDHAEGGRHADEIKQRCMKVALEQVQNRPFLKGFFLWKWFPSLNEDATNYTLQYPSMKALFRKNF